MSVIGNMCEDRTPDGWRPGGPALYCALAARALGADVTLIGAIGPSCDDALLAGIMLITPPGAAAAYENSYDGRGNRKQRLLAPGSTLDFPPGVKADALILAPAYRELARLPHDAEAPVVGVALQGALRAVAGDRVVRRREPLRHVQPFLRPGAWAFLSEEDTVRPEELARGVVALGAQAFVTRGARGATRYVAGEERHFAAQPATPLDPTGAGDCFAAAFIVRYAETRDLESATAYALAAGSLAVEGAGISGIPGRAKVEARLRMAAAG